MIQNLQELRQGGVAITIAKYQTPQHNDINKIGIVVNKELNVEDRDCDIDVCLEKIIN